MADPIGTQDPTNAATETTTPPAGETPEQESVRLKAENESLRKEKDMLHGRATRAEADLKTKTAPPTQTTPAGGSGSPSLEEVERRIEEKAELRQEGFSREELTEAEAFAKAKGITLSDAVKHPFVKAAIDGLRAEKRAKEATPSSTRRGSQPFKVEEVAKMKPAERQEQHNFDAWRQRKRTEVRR